MSHESDNISVREIKLASLIFLHIFFKLVSIFLRHSDQLTDFGQGAHQMRHLSIYLIPLFVCFSQTPGIQKDALKGYQSINANDLRNFDIYLSSDTLQGRETSYPGEHMAAEYIANHFKSLGLKPIGDDGSYYQHYDVEQVSVSDGSSISVGSPEGPRLFPWSKSFFTFGVKDTSVTGTAVFVGYMNNVIPDSLLPFLEGKVVFVFVGNRRPADDTSASPMTRRSVQFPGAAATIVVMDDNGPASYERFAAMISSFGIAKGRMQLKDAESTAPRRATPLMLLASPSVAESALRSSGENLNRLKALAFRDSVFHPFEIRSSITVQLKTIREERQAENVVGLLEGSDPVLRNQVVVFSAHFDHLGVGPDGAIYHGADDDGSGTSMVMDLAKAFSENRVRPKRSLLFLTVSGEEKGLLGSSYYTSHPIIPLNETIADFNTDMIGRMDTAHEKSPQEPYAYLIGSDKISTELDSLIRVANKESENIRLDYTYDSPNDPNHFYSRSDHYNFARKGIPIASFFTGVHADYHRPTDTVDKILFDRIVKIGHVVYYSGWLTANFDRMFTKNVQSSEYRR